MTLAARDRRTTPAGRLELEAVDGEVCEALAAATLAAASSERASFGRRVRLAGRDAWLKGGPLRGRARARHALREHVLREAPARLREARNLLWLAAHDAPTVAPLGVAVLRRAGLVRFQCLATAWLEGALPLDAWWPGADSARRQDVVTHLARDVASLHARGFVHRDLFFRNLLVPPGDAPRAHLIDAWRGGPDHRWRGADYDLACLMVDAGGAWSAADQQHFFAAYLEERRLHAPDLDPGALLERARREHARLARRLARAGRAAPGRWDPPPLHLPRPGPRAGS